MIKQAAPWDISLEKRIKAIQDQQKRYVLFIHESFQHATSRYRVYNIYQSLGYSENWMAAFFTEEEIPEIESIIPGASLVIFSRMRWSPLLQRLAKICKSLSISTAYDIDDLIFNIKKIPSIINHIAYHQTDVLNLDFWFTYVSRIWLMANSCDHLICTNDYLKNELKEVFTQPVHVLSNFLNEEQIQASKPLYEKKSSCQDAFSLGYFSGSNTHKSDLNEISSELSDFLDTFPEAKLKVVGHMDLPISLQKFKKNKQLIQSSFVHFIDLQKEIADVDVNLVPLQNNIFTNCKSELKFFEAAIVGTITCASPTFVFQENIKHNETGFLCRPGFWFDTLENIYHKKTCTDLRENALQYCLNKYSPKNQCQLIEAIYEAICR